MKRRLVVMLLCFAMLVSSLAGCASTDKKTDVSSKQETTSGENEEANGEIALDHFAGTTIKIVYVRREGEKSQSQNEKLAFKMAEEATGIHVEWIELESGAAADKVAVMLASDEQPDAYWACINEGTLVQNEDLWYDLSEEGLLETYAPDLKAQYDANGVWDYLEFQDGSIYGFMTGEFASPKYKWTASPLWINTDWLDKVGMDVPTTADEFYEVLCAFRDNDVDGDGDPNNEIPLSFCSGYWQASVMMLANAFGIGGDPHWMDEKAYKMLENGEVKSTVDTDNYRAFLEFYHKLIEEGLMDVEGFSQTSDQYDAKVNAKLVGAFCYDSAALNGMIDSYVPFTFQGIEGVDPRITGGVNRFAGQRSNFVITADSENVEAVVHWWNYLSSTTEMKYITYCGEEGILWERDEEGNFWRTTNPNTDATEFDLGVGNYAPAVFAGEEMDTEEILPGRKAQYDWIDENIDYIPKELFPTKYTDAESEEERAAMEIELFDYIVNFTATSIMNGVTDESWEQHLKDLKAVQYYDWLQWYQDYMDGTL